MGRLCERKEVCEIAEDGDAGLSSIAELALGVFGERFFEEASDCEADSSESCLAFDGFKEDSAFEEFGFGLFCVAEGNGNTRHLKLGPQNGIAHWIGRVFWVGVEEFGQTVESSLK